MKNNSIFRTIIASFLAIFISVAGISAEHKHVAPHGGVLAEIEACGTGHVELLVKENTLELWFLDDGHNVDRTVPIVEERIPISLITKDGKRIECQAIAQPVKLAGEKPGRCSHFIARIDGIEKIVKFEGYGWVRFKGSVRPLRLSFPKGLSSHESGSKETCSDHDHDHDQDQDQDQDHDHDHDHDSEKK